MFVPFSYFVTSTIRLVEGFGNGSIPITTDLEGNSTAETGASSADDEENVPFSFDMSNRVSYNHSVAYF